MPGAKTGLVDYISRHPNQKAKKFSAHDEEFIVAKLKLISTSVNSLNLKPTESAVHFNIIIQANALAHQITFQATHYAINLISTHATRVHKHYSHLSHAPRNQISITSDNFNNLKYAYPTSQIPINTSLAKQNTAHCNQFFQNWNGLSLVTSQSHFTKCICRKLGDILRIFLKVTTQK